MADEPKPPVSRTTMARWIAAGVVVLVLLVFAILNRHRERIDFIIFKRDSRLIYIIIGSALLGALADRLLIVRRRRSRGPGSR
jgi:uncharacterized integral membrane protein